MRGDFPGQDKEAKKAGEEGYEAVRASAQQYVCLPYHGDIRNTVLIDIYRPTKPGPKPGKPSRSSIP
jgi:hypothetical protein